MADNSETKVLVESLKVLDQEIDLVQETESLRLTSEILQSLYILNNSLEVYNSDFLLYVRNVIKDPVVLKDLLIKKIQANMSDDEEV